MKLLVTGGAGFIGSAVVRSAIMHGHTVINVDCLTYASNLANVAAVSDSSLYHFEKIDIRDIDAVQSVYENHRPDAIMHLAAESHVDRSIDEPGAFIETNVLGTFNLLATARRYWDDLSPTKRELFRFHHISTDEVYGDLGPDDPAFSEATSYDPSSPYSASKASSDHLVRAWGRTYGLPILITNCSNNYGPYQFPEKLIPVVILNALHRNPIPVYGTGDNIRDWLFVDDHVDALFAVLEKGRPGETYNIGGNSERTNIELVQTLCKLMRQKSDEDFDYASLIEFVTDRPGHDRRYAVNADKIKSELSWSPKTSFEDGLESTLSWYVENETWWRPLVCSEQFFRRQGKIVRATS